MLDPYLNLFRVNPEDGSLQNTDGVFEIESLGPDGAKKFLEIGNTFQGGNWLHLHSMLEIDAGEEILYVGDHLYSDVLRSKRTLGWRSCFIMPELEDEMRDFSENKELASNISDLRRLMEELSVYKEEVLLNKDESDPAVQQTLAELDDEINVVKELQKGLTEKWHNVRDNGKNISKFPVLFT